VCKAILELSWKHWALLLDRVRKRKSWNVRLSARNDHKGNTMIRVLVGEGRHLLWQSAYGSDVQQLCCDDRCVCLWGPNLKLNFGKCIFLQFVRRPPSPKQSLGANCTNFQCVCGVRLFVYRILCCQVHLLRELRFAQRRCCKFKSPRCDALPF
jgi:hypothetical protein